jgi:hypothetical protein
MQVHQLQVPLGTIPEGETFVYQGEWWQRNTGSTHPAFAPCTKLGTGVRMTDHGLDIQTVVEDIRGKVEQA